MTERLMAAVRWSEPAAAAGSHDLVLAAAQQSDEGRYQCVARNMAGVRHSTQALLSVYGIAKLASNFVFEAQHCYNSLSSGAVRDQGP